MLIARFESIALAMTLIFVGVTGLLLYLVPLAFQASRSRFGHWEEKAAEFFGTNTGIRIRGVMFALIGIGFVVWSWRDANDRGSFFVKMAVLGPTMIGIGTWVMIEAPDPEHGKFSPLGWILIGLGVSTGVLYWRYLTTGVLPLLG